ncbi:MAG: glycosyltransferase family 4 protein [Phycisphaerae bacterium]
MKICHIITRMIIGGAQENTYLTCRGLAERGHEVLLLSGPETGPEGSLWPVLESSPFDTKPVDNLRRSIHPMRDWRALRDLTTMIRDFAPDVVHTHSSKAGILGRYAAARAKVPAIIHTIHGMSFNRTQTWWRRKVYESLERSAARKTHGMICVADAMTEQALAANVGHPSMYTTIRSGMEVDTFFADETQYEAVRSSWGVQPGTVTIGTIARLFRNKGYEELLKAMPLIVDRLPDVRFVWIGDGAQRAEYTSQLERLGLLDKVHFTGLVRPDQIPGLLRGMDVLVHASRWEGLPRAVVQALLSEVPAVSFDNDGAREVITHGETGFLAPFGDCDALAQAVLDLAADEAVRSRMGKLGRERCLIPFDWRTMTTEIEKVYDRVLRDEARPADRARQ